MKKNREGLKRLTFISSAFILMIGLTGCHGGGYSGSGYYDVYDPYYSDPYYSDPYYSDPYYNDPYYSDPYYSDPYYSGGWYSYGMASNDEGGNSKDLIADVAENENQVITTAGQKFAAKYALSDEKGIQIARTLRDFASISVKQKRARTDKDIADFSMRLYGIPADKAKTAIENASKGKPEGLENLNNEVATFWGTSPETSKTILKNWYKHKLTELHVN